MPASIAIADPPRRARAARGVWTPWTDRNAETGMLALFFAVTAATFPGDAALLYGLAGYYLVGAWTHRAAVLRLARRAWIVWLLPLWAICSMLWSPEPAFSLRGGLQLLLSVLICVVAVARLSPRRIVVAVFTAGLALLLLSLPALPAMAAGEAFAGVFDQKNHLAKRIGTLAFAAAALLCDRGAPGWARLLAFAALPVAGAVLLATQSATGILCGALGVALVFAVALAWRSAGRARLAVLGGAVAAVGLLGLGLVNTPRADPAGMVFEAFGKDRTLTGRTELWRFAGAQIAARPVTGLGQNAFWRPNRLDAQGLVEAAHKPRGASFSFHNAFLEVGVALGVTGLILGALTTAWAAWRVTAWAVLAPSAASGFFFAATLVALVRSAVESDLFQQFEAVQMLVWIGALLALTHHGSGARR